MAMTTQHQEKKKHLGFPLSTYLGVHLCLIVHHCRKRRWSVNELLQTFTRPAHSCMIHTTQEINYKSRGHYKNHIACHGSCTLFTSCPYQWDTSMVLVFAGIWLYEDYSIIRNGNLWKVFYMD